MTEKVVIGNATHIYALAGPDMVPRYVGKTSQSLRARLVEHKRIAKQRARLPVHYWVRKQPRWEPSIVWIETVPAGEDWASRERYWIRELKAQGFDLLNLTDGGEGLCGHNFSADHRERISSSLKRGAFVPCASCGISVWRKPSAIRSARSFCTRLCSNNFNKGGRRV